MSEAYSAPVQEALDELARLARGLSGMRQAFDEPPDSLNAWPAALVYAGEAEERNEARQVRIDQDLVCEIHYPRQQNLTKAVQAVMPFGDSLPAAVWADVTLSGRVTKVTAISRGLEWDREYNGIDTLALVVTVRATMYRRAT